MKQLWMNSKRVLAVLLAVMMLVALLPVVAVTAATTGSVTVTAANYASGLTMTVDDASQLVYTQTDDSNNSHYYRMPVIVDGRAGHIAVELSGNNLTTWGAFDTAYGLPMAAEYIAVGAGTVVAEIRQKNGWGEPISGGAEITIENGFYLRKIDGAWTFCQPEAGTVDVFPRSTATSTLMWYMAPLPADYARYYRFDNAGVQVNGAATGNTIWFESAVAADASNYGSVCWVGGGYSSVTVAGGTNVIPCDPNTGLDLTNSSFTINQDFAATVDGTWTVTATEPAPPAPIDTNVTLAFDSAPAAGQFYFTYEADARVTEKYYSMSVLANGTATTAVLELGANWDMTHAFIWSLPAATESLRIPAGTTLTESTSDGAAIAGGQTLTLAEELRIVCTDGTWSNYVKPAPTALTLTFNSVNQSNHWAFNYAENASLPPVGQWYVTTATVDGEERSVLMEYYPAGSLFYIYSNCFAAAPNTAAAPSSSLKIAAGAVLVPISTPDASATIEGVEFALTDAIDVAYEDGVWIDKTLVAEEVTLAVDTTKGTGGYMGEWTYAYGGTTYNVVSVALSNSPYVDAWLHAEGVVSTESGDVDVLLAMPDNGECWICFADTPPTEFTINTDTVFATIDKAYEFTFGKTLTVNTATDSLVYATLVSINLTFAQVGDEGGTPLWVYTADDVSNATASYYKVSMIVDGNAQSAIMEKRDGTFVLYPGFFTAFGGSAPVESVVIEAGALMIPIDPNNGWAVLDDTYLKIGKRTEVAYDDSWHTAYEVGFIGADATLSGTVELGFYAYLKGVSNASVTFAVADDSVTVTLAEATLAGKNLYRFPVEIVAARMAVTVTATLNADGAEFTRTYSVKEYGEAIIAGAYSEQAKDLAAAMLNYGGYVQDYFIAKGRDGIETLRANADLADTSLPAIGKSELAAFRAVRVTTGTVPTYVGHSLLLEGKTSLRLYFRGATTDGYTFWANGTELTLTQKGGNYYAEIPDIGSLALFTRYDVKILKDGVVQGRMVVSPMTYALAIVESTDEAESNLAKALYAYNLAAQNYNDVNFGLDIQW